MIICPTCNREFSTPEEVAKHSLSCWKEHNPNVKSKPAPRGETIEKRKVSNDVLSLFQFIQEVKNNARNSD